MNISRNTLRSDLSNVPNHTKGTIKEVYVADSAFGKVWYEGTINNFAVFTGSSAQKTFVPLDSPHSPCRFSPDENR